jgi:hypothetical protein
VIALCLGGYFLGRYQRKPKETRPRISELSGDLVFETPQLETKEKPGKLEGRNVILVSHGIGELEG